MKKNREREIKEAQGEKSRRIASENLAKVLIVISKKPMSFSELLFETKLSKPVLMKHLRTLKEKDAIYKDTIKPTETSNPKEIGKIVYKLKEDEMEKFFMEAVMVTLPTIPDMFKDKDTREKLEFHAREITKAIIQYLNELRANREPSLKAELERIKKK